MILWLDEIAPAHRGVVGGKAASLAAMLRAGFRVPPGFCVTTAAYRAFVRVNDLTAPLSALAAGEGADPHALFAHPMDAALVAAVLAACRRLLEPLPAGSLLAVRSSATIEDRPDASFAGQGETYLNVPLDDVPDRVRTCWASLWTARAIAYRRRGDANQMPEMAVVVQAMIPCEVGGVAFTTDPMGGAAIVIEAAPGLAESVVQGTGAITRYSVDRHTLSLPFLTPSTPLSTAMEKGKRGAWQGAEQGVRTEKRRSTSTTLFSRAAHAPTYNQEGEDLLTPNQMRRIAETALALEARFGGAQDVEWGWWRGDLYLFQSRPVTTEAERFFTQVIPGDDHLWTGGYLNERFPRPVSPLGWSVVGGLTEELAFHAPLRYLGYRRHRRMPLIKLYRGHPYVNVTVFQILYKVFPDGLVPEDAARYFPDGDTSLRKRAPYPCCLFDPRFVASMLWHFIHEPANWSPLHNYRHWARFAVRHEAAMAELIARAETAASLNDLWDMIESAQRWNRALLSIHRWSLMAADLAVPLLRRLLGRWVSAERRNELCARLLSGLPNKSLEMDQALRRLAEALDSTGEAMQAFLREYGHRSFNLDIYYPTFADDPTQVQRLLEVVGQGPDPAARIAARESAEREVQAALRAGPLGWLRRPILDGVLSLARRYVILREEQRFVWQRTLALMRRVLLRIGAHFAAEGILAQADDIFFATLEEAGMLARSVSCRDTACRVPTRQGISSRRAAFERLQREFEIAPALTYPAFLRGNQPLERGEAEGANRWQGTPVSPGLVRGPVRVVLTPEHLDHLAPGDILVTQSTDPGWTPAFGRLAGLIMARGGQLSHGAVVAREYGLPAVVGIPHITERLHDGDIVLLDGMTGVVVLEGGPIPA
jgi:phosphohistidine swiveling domain-containing protein